MAELIPKTAVAATAGVLLVLGAPILTALCVGGLVFLWRANPGPHSHAGHASGHRLSEEDGWLIVEIMIGAVVLILAGLAIYSGLDGASRTSGANRNRTVAAYLAQQDQERMRTMDAAALSGGYTSTRTVTVANVPFRVDSAATLVNDSTGSVSCTNKSSTAQYLKITSTVYDPTGRNAPVVQDSLLSPKPADGNAAVQVVDRTGTNGVSGVPVALQEPPGNTVTTDGDGCSLFSFLDNGTQYQVSFSLPGYVDVNGANTVTGPITVVPGNVSLTQFQYDQAGSILANFPAGKACTAVTVSNSHMKLTPPIRTFPQSGCSSADPSVAATNSATSLFPFTDAYAVYAGACTVNDPTNTAWRQPATYAGILTPGGSQSMTPAEPNITVTVKRSTGSSRSPSTSNYAGADVVFTETDCSSNALPRLTSNASAVAQLGVPYGKYSICADDNQGSTSHTGSASVTNNSAGGKSVTVTIDATTGSATGSGC